MAYTLINTGKDLGLARSGDIVHCTHDDRYYLVQGWVDSAAVLTALDLDLLCESYLEMLLNDLICDLDVAPKYFYLFEVLSVSWEI